MILVGLLRYAHVLEHVGPSLLNTLGLAAGWICAAGLTMVGNFQVRLQGGKGPGRAEMGDREHGGGEGVSRPGCAQLLQGVVVADEMGPGVVPFCLLAPLLSSGSCPSLGTGVAPCCGSGLCSLSQEANAEATVCCCLLGRVRRWCCEHTSVVPRSSPADTLRIPCLQVDHAKVLHYIGAGVAFPTSMLFVFLQSVLTYRAAKTRGHYWTGHLRSILTAMAFVTLVFSILLQAL